MFESVSWSQYFAFVAVLLLVYYVFIALVYYGREINALIYHKPARLSVPQQQPASAAPVMGSTGDRQPVPRSQQTQAEDKKIVPGTENVMEEVGFMMDDIKTMLEETGTKTSRAELMEKIPREIASYAAIADLRPFEFLINQFIIKQTAVICKIELDGSDLSAIWKKINAKN